MQIAVLANDGEELALIASILQPLGHDCQAFTLGSALERELLRETVDLVVLDWQLPDTTGPQFARWARTTLKDRVPMLMMTQRNDEEDIVEALVAGADDIIVSPIRPGELAARVCALMRRAYVQQPTDEQRWGRYHFLPARQRLEMDGAPVVLTQKQYNLALLLFRNMGRVLSRRYLLESIWGINNPMGPEQVSRSLDTHVSRVRAALGLRPESGYRLAAVYGQGYRFEAVEVDASSLA
jgi:DNA-binding response OmpR family regulator